MIKLESIIQVGALVGAILTIWKVVSPIQKKMDDIDEQLKDLKDGQVRNEIHNLRLAVLEENLPLGERIACAERYFKLGGNGYIKYVYKELLKELEKQNGVR